MKSCYASIICICLFYIPPYYAGCPPKKFDSTMNKPKVLITNPTIPQGGIDVLAEKCVLIRTNNTSREQILKNVVGVDGILWSSKEKLDSEILNAAGCQLKVVATVSVGYDNIDVPELTKRGIKLSNTPQLTNNAVADIAILLTLATSRRFQEARKEIETNRWDSSMDLGWMVGQDIENSTVGIIGLGGIGQTIVRRMQGFGVGRFIYTGHREKPEGKKLGASFVNLDTIARESDFIILSVPLTNETRGMINDDFLSKVKKTAILINISRGAVVDQDALIRALKEQRLFAAGLDVTVPEPLPADHELVSLPNVVLTPHIGSATSTTRENMSVLAAQNVLRGLHGDELITPVN